MQNRAKVILITVVAIIFAGSVLGYAYYTTRDLIRGPQVEITSPINGTTLDSSQITIEGAAHNIQEITLNDRKIFIDEEGAINEDILLSYGYNIFTIKARDKFGRETTKELELVFK